MLNKTLLLCTTQHSFLHKVKKAEAQAENYGSCGSPTLPPWEASCFILHTLCLVSLGPFGSRPSVFLTALTCCLTLRDHIWPNKKVKKPFKWCLSGPEGGRCTWICTQFWCLLCQSSTKFYRTHLMLQVLHEMGLLMNDWGASYKMEHFNGLKSTFVGRALKMKTASVQLGFWMQSILSSKMRPRGCSPKELWFNDTRQHNQFPLTCARLSVALVFVQPQLW